MYFCLMMTKANFVCRVDFFVVSVISEMYDKNTGHVE